MADGGGQFDERDLIHAAQRGDAGAAHSLVARHERELLRTAFLLTDDQRQTLRLVGRTWERAFRELRRLDPESPFRRWLFERLARALLSPEQDDEDRQPDIAAVFYTDPGRYRVEDERRRLRAALMTLDASERIALVLREFNGLDVENIANGVSEPAGDVERRVRGARRQLAGRVNVPEGQSVGVALTEAALEAPRVQVWPAVEERVLEIQNDEVRRTRRLTGGVVCGVSLLAIAVLSLLIYGAISDEEAAGDTGAENDVEPAAATASPIIVDSPAQTPRESEPAYDPDGEVPDLLLRMRDGSSSVAGRNVLHGLQDTVRVLLPPGRPLTISPDGGTLILVDDEPAERGINWSLIAVDLSSGVEQWRVSLEGGLVWQGFDPVIDAAIAGDQLIVAAHDPGFRTDLVVIARYALDSGQELGQSEIDINQSNPDVFVFPRTDQAQAIVIAESRSGNGVSTVLVDVGEGGMTFSPGREFSPVEFDFDQAVLTPGGNGLYAMHTVSGSDGTTRTDIRFVNFSSFSISSVALPFRSGPPAGGLRTTTSHDGRWLYVVSPADRQFAVVDLHLRQVERLAPLEAPGLDPREPEVEPVIYTNLENDRRAALSLDGRYLYVVGPYQEADDVVATSIWRIDVTTWTVVDRWQHEDVLPIGAIYAGADDGLLAVHTSSTDDGESVDRTGQLLVVDIGSGEITRMPDAGRGGYELFGTLADVYRDTYGKSPAVGERTPAVVSEFTSLPRTQIELEPERVVPGQAVTVTVSFLDPEVVQSDREVFPNLESVRFDPQSVVTVLFTDGTSRHLLTPGEEEHGVYAVMLRIEEPGTWDVLVTIDAPEGSRTVVFNDALQVRRTFQSPDGFSYYLAISSVTPTSPRAGNPVEIAVRFIETTSGEPVTEDVEIVGGSPRELPIAEATGVAGTLFRDGDGGYTGVVSFAAAGPHVLRLIWTDAGGEEQVVEVGPVRVGG